MRLGVRTDVQIYLLVRTTGTSSSVQTHTFHGHSCRGLEGQALVPVNDQQFDMLVQVIRRRFVVQF